MRKPLKTRFEEAQGISRAYGFAGSELERVAKHIYAKMIVGGATIGKVNGKIVVHRPQFRPKLPN